MGTWMQSVAQGWLVYDLTGSKLALGIITFIGTIPTLLFMLPAGAVADRVSRRNMMLVTQTVMMICAFILAFFTGTKSLQVWHIAVVGFILGIAKSFDSPARLALTVELVDDRRDLQNAIALNSSMFNLARVVGPAIGGVVLGSRGRGLVLRPQRPQLRGGADCFMGDAPQRSREAAAHPAHDRRDRRRAALRVGHDGVHDYRCYGGGHVDFRLFLFRPDAGVCSGVFNVGEAGLGALNAAVGVGALIGSLTVASLNVLGARAGRLTVGSLFFPIALIGFAFSRNFYLSLAAIGRRRLRVHHPEHDQQHSGADDAGSACVAG